MKSETSKVSQWWENSIIEMSPGQISFRGQPVQDLMETMSFTQMLFFMVLGRKISREESRLFEVAMVMSVDHGPHAPSIAIARMASTCGIEINNVMASAVNVLGDNHGGAVQGCAELYYQVGKKYNVSKDLQGSVERCLARYREHYGKFIPGFGHRFHNPSDPRALKTIELVEQYSREGVISGVYRDIAMEIERQINENRSRVVPMNVDGASAIIFCELGIPAPLCRGFFCLSRSVGILAHAWEEIQGGKKNKGPIPLSVMPLYSPKE